MSETRALYTAPPEHVRVELTAKDWQTQLLAKVSELRLANKRAILLVDGSRIFVFSAEPRGTIALD